MDDVTCLQRDAAPGPSQNTNIVEDRRNIQMTRNDDLIESQREKVIFDICIRDTYVHVFAQMPYTERLKQFRQLLKENNITATSNWEDELNNVFKLFWIVLIFSFLDHF